MSLHFRLSEHFAMSVTLTFDLSGRNGAVRHKY